MDKELEYTTATAPIKLAELGRTGQDGRPLKSVTVRYLARMHDIGTRLKGSRDWLFSEADLEKMAELPRVGRPAAESSQAEADDDGLPPPAPEQSAAPVV